MTQPSNIYRGEISTLIKYKTIWINPLMSYCTTVLIQFGYNLDLPVSDYALRLFPYTEESSIQVQVRKLIQGGFRFQNISRSLIGSITCKHFLDYKRISTQPVDGIIFYFTFLTWNCLFTCSSIFKHDVT